METGLSQRKKKKLPETAAYTHVALHAADLVFQPLDLTSHLRQGPQKALVDIPLRDLGSRVLQEVFNSGNRHERRPQGYAATRPGDARGWNRA